MVDSSETWQKVGVEEIRGPEGKLFAMAQLYVPDQEIGMNLYGPEWLIDAILRDHEQARLAERYADALRRIEAMYEPTAHSRPTNARMMMYTAREALMRGEVTYR